MRNELYFCLHLTENEHYIICSELEELCEKHDLELLYYRQLKEGHVPMFREIKLRGEIGYVRGYIEKAKLEEHIVPNPHRRPKCDSI